MSESNPTEISQRNAETNETGSPVVSSIRRTDASRPKRNRTLTVSFREPQEPLPLRGYQLAVLALASYVNFTSNLAFTILATFFDESAAQKGLSPFDTGLIVAIYACSAALCCPIFGAYLDELGKKFTLVAGLLTAAVCAGLFSLLDKVDSATTFYWTALCLRSFQAIGTSAYFTATYAVLVEEWRGSKLAFGLGIYEAFTGLGMVLGPIAGSLLFSAGGYSLPFYVVAAMLTAAAGVAFFVLESDDEIVRSGYTPHIDNPDEEFEEEFPLRKVVKVLLSNGLFLIPNILLIPVWSCMDFCMPFIGPYLTDAGISDNKNVHGLLFVGMAVSYSLSSILWGYLVGRFRVSRSLMFFGALFSALSYLFLGPSPWLALVQIHLPCSVKCTCVAMVVLGASLSAAVLPSVNEMVDVSRQEGCAEQATGFIAGLMNSLIFLGEFLGPTLGGLLLVHCDGDFALAASYFALACSTIVLLCGIGYIILKMKRKWSRVDETDQERRIRHVIRERDNRRRRRRRTESLAHSFSLGPRSLNESITNSMRMAWSERQEPGNTPAGNLIMPIN